MFFSPSSHPIATFAACDEFRQMECSVRAAERRPLPQLSPRIPGRKSGKGLQDDDPKFACFALHTGTCRESLQGADLWLAFAANDRADKFELENHNQSENCAADSLQIAQ
jgi:hypothetical protein